MRGRDRAVSPKVRDKPVETDPYLKQIVELPDEQPKAVMNVDKEMMGEMTERIFPSGTKIYQQEPDGNGRAEPYRTWSYDLLGAAPRRRYSAEGDTRGVEGRCAESTQPAPRKRRARAGKSRRPGTRGSGTRARQHGERTMSADDDPLS